MSRVAVAEEDGKPAEQLWKGELTPERIEKEQGKRVRVLRENGRTYPQAGRLVDRLAGCRRDQRCWSGACRQCAQLLQRWFVRRSRKFIARHLEMKGAELVAISIVPLGSTVMPGQLDSFSIVNFQRRLKYLVAKADVQVATGGVDFSFNENRRGKISTVLEPAFLSD